MESNPAQMLRIMRGRPSSVDHDGIEPSHRLYSASLYQKFVDHDRVELSFGLYKRPVLADERMIQIFATVSASSYAYKSRVLPLNDRSNEAIITFVERNKLCLYQFICLFAYH